MNWNIQKARTGDAEAIAGFQVAMAMESEGLALDEGTVLKGVQAALENPSKGLYFVARDESGAIAGSLAGRGCRENREPADISPEFLIFVKV